MAVILAHKKGPESVVGITAQAQQHVYKPIVCEQLVHAPTNEKTKQKLSCCQRNSKSDVLFENNGCQVPAEEIQHMAYHQHTVTKGSVRYGILGRGHISAHGSGSLHIREGTNSPE